MNVERSIFVRRGYPLTALAVAVLLAGFSGTAWAQTTGVSTTAKSSFKGSSGTLPEGADEETASKPRPLKVTITRTPKKLNDPYNTSNHEVGPAAGRAHLVINFEYNGDPGLPDGITVTQDDPSNTAVTEGAALTFQSSDNTREEKTGLKVDHPDDVADDDIKPEDRRQIDGDPHIVTIAKSEIVLTFKDTRADDGDWLTEEFVMTVSKNSTATGLGPTNKSEGTTQNPYVNDFDDEFKVNIADDDPKPKFRFSSRNIHLAEENIQTVTVSVGVGPGGASPLPGDTGDDATASIHGKLESLPPGAGDPNGIHDVWLTVVPQDAVGRIINIRKAGQGTGDDTIFHPDAKDRYVVGVISKAASAEGIKFRIEAREVSGFRDEQVTLMLMDGRTPEQAKADGGGIDAADAATVTVLSGEETPTVTFSDR